MAPALAQNLRLIKDVINRKIGGAGRGLGREKICYHGTSIYKYPQDRRDCISVTRDDNGMIHGQSRLDSCAAISCACSSAHTAPRGRRSSTFIFNATVMRAKLLSEWRQGTGAQIAQRGADPIPPLLE
jgi:hypothetical protein